MPLRAETLEFIRELERSSNRKLDYPNDVGYLLESARRLQKMDAFGEATFLAKFVTKSLAVIKRIGPDGEGYDKIYSEFQASLQKTSSLLRSLNQGLPDEIRQSQEALFFTLTQESLDRLLKLMMDLSLVKNWTLDGNPLLGETTGEL